MTSLIITLWVALLLRDSVVLCQHCRSLKKSNCVDLYGNVKHENDLNYPCFAGSIETNYCKCHAVKMDEGDLELINSRMMCTKERRFVGEVWFDPNTCQKKRCNEDEKVTVIEGGCLREDTNSQDPEQYCVPVGFSPFPCIFEMKYYERCRCGKYDNETAVGQPVMCGTHVVGSVYESGCDKVVCQPDGKQRILEKRCQKSDGSCVTDTTQVYPCYINGLIRGACKCDRGCNVETEVKRRYRVVVTYSSAVDTNGHAIVSLSGTINETPLQRLDTVAGGRRSEKTFTAQYVGIPRKLVYQFQGKDGGYRETLTVEDLESGKRYQYSPSGTNDAGLSTKVVGSTGIYMETNCLTSECKNTKVFTETTVEYKMMFYCPSAIQVSLEIPLKHVYIALMGEHMFSGFQPVENDDMVETTSTGKGSYTTFQSKYHFPYSGNIVSFILRFDAGVWLKTCTIRLNLPVRQQEFEFRYIPDYRYRIRRLDCINSPHCGNTDWDLVCDNGNLADWCKKDECCSRAAIPCGRLCYTDRDAYQGKWEKTQSGKKCATACSKRRGDSKPPTCVVEGQGHSENCDIPHCSHIRFQGGKAFVVVNQIQIRSASKDICFNQFGGRLVMVDDKDFHEKEFQNGPLGYGLWVEGYYGVRSPTHWQMARALLPRWVDTKSKRPNWKLLNTNDNGDLNGCLYGSGDEVWSTNCIRSAYPMCEVLFTPAS